MMLKVAVRCFCSNSRLITPFIELAEPGTAGVITLNRPREINAINHEMSEYVESNFRLDPPCHNHLISAKSTSR